MLEIHGEKLVGGRIEDVIAISSTNNRVVGSVLWLREFRLQVDQLPLNQIHTISQQLKRRLLSER